MVVGIKSDIDCEIVNSREYWGFIDMISTHALWFQGSLTSNYEDYYFSSFHSCVSLKVAVQWN